MQIRTIPFILLSIFVGLCPRTAFGQAVVAPTDPKTPEEERKTFKLPAGFEARDSSPVSLTS